MTLPSIRSAPDVPPEPNTDYAQGRTPRGRIHNGLRHFLIVAMGFSALACFGLALLFKMLFGVFFILSGAVYAALGVGLFMANEQRILAVLASVALLPVAFILFILSLW